MMNRLCGLFLALLLLSPALDLPEPAADWDGLTYMHERLRQSGVSNEVYVADVEVREVRHIPMCWMTFWLPGRGWVEMGVPISSSGN